MAEFAPGFGNGGGCVIPKPTNPLAAKEITNALVQTTVGAAAGTTTTVNHARAAGTVDNAGLRTIETVQPINRASAAADVTALKTKFTKKKASFGFVRDLSGNGGPAFTRT